MWGLKMFAKAVCFSWKKVEWCNNLFGSYNKLNENGVFKNEYSEGVKIHGLIKNFGKILFFDQKLWKLVGL